MPWMQLQLDEPMYERLQAYAKRYGQTMQGSVREAIAEYITRREPAEKGSFTFLDLFAGPGAMHLAFAAAGGQCVFACEKDKFCRKAYLENFHIQPSAELWEIPSAEILTASFPVQEPVKQGGSFEERYKGTAFGEICQALQQGRPKAFLLECGTRLIKRKRELAQDMQDALETLSYQTFCERISGRGFVPQAKERFLLAGFDRERYHGEAAFSFSHGVQEELPVMQDILEKEASEKYTLSDAQWQTFQDDSQPGSGKTGGFYYGIAPLKGAARTFSSRYYKDGKEILILQERKNPRKLTPREALRLHGYPEDYQITVSDLQIYRQMGTSPIVSMVTEAAKRLLAEVKRLEGTHEKVLGEKRDKG